MNEKRTRRQCAGTLGECEEKTREETIVERFSQSWWRQHLLCTHTPPSPLFPREPQTKKKNGIGILRVGTPPPQRSATTTASFSSSDDHSPRNPFRVPRSRSHRPHHSRVRIFPRRDFFPLTKENALIPRKIFARGESAPPFFDRCANVGKRRATPVRVAFVFRSVKKRTIFLFFFFFFFCCFVAVLNACKRRSEFGERWKGDVCFLSFRGLGF